MHSLPAFRSTHATCRSNAVVALFRNLIVRVNQVINPDQAFLISLPEGFQPLDVVRVRDPVIDLAVFLIGNSQEVLQVAGQTVAATALCIEGGNIHTLIVAYSFFSVRSVFRKPSGVDISGLPISSYRSLRTRKV